MKLDDNLIVCFCLFRFGFFILDYFIDVFDWYGVVLMGLMGRNVIFNCFMNFVFVILES